MPCTLCEHRLKNWEEIIELIKNDPTFSAYINTVYKILNSIEPGTTYYLKRIRPENRIKFVKIASMYISERREVDYAFGINCSSIHRYEESVEQTIKRLNEDRHGRKWRSQKVDSKTAGDTATGSGWIESGGNRREV